MPWSVTGFQTDWFCSWHDSWSNRNCFGGRRAGRRVQTSAWSALCLENKPVYWRARLPHPPQKTSDFRQSFVPSVVTLVNEIWCWMSFDMWSWGFFWDTGMNCVWSGLAVSPGLIYWSIHQQYLQLFFAFSHDPVQTDLWFAAWPEMLHTFLTESCRHAALWFTHRDAAPLRSLCCVSVISLRELLRQSVEYIFSLHKTNQVVQLLLSFSWCIQRKTGPWMKWFSG